MSGTWDIEIPKTFAGNISSGGAGVDPVLQVFDFHFCDASRSEDAGFDSLTRFERARAEKFHQRIDRNRYVVGRSMLRQALGMVLGMPPVEVPIQLEKGRPYLDQSVFNSVFFNLSHSGNRVVLILSGECPVGIDVEVERNFPDRDQVARRVMSHGEFGHYQSLEPASRTAAFFRLWVRKESIMKCLGKGFEIEPRRITVGHDACSSTEGHFEGQMFHLRQFKESGGREPHYLAIACSGQNGRFRLDRHSIAAFFN